MTWRADMATVAFCTWLIAGLAVDGWAHVNLRRLETFFTPWHAIFYSGFLTTAAWIIWNVRRRSRGVASALEAVPAGYGLGLVGLAMFAVGGVLDMIWHIVYGIEVNIDALLSPTHLLLYAGGFLIITSPFRAAWTDPDLSTHPTLSRFLPALMSITLASALSAFMFMYLSPFLDVDMGAKRSRALVEAYGSKPGFVIYLSQRGGIAAILFTTLLLFAPVLVILRRWRPPFGAFCIMFTAVATVVQGITAFERPWLLLAAFAGGLGTDILVARLKPYSATPARIRTFAFLAPLLLWGAYSLVVAATEGVSWRKEIWLGALFWSGLAGVGLSLLMVPPALPPPQHPGGSA
jgi:hypothetical protein